MEPTDKFIKNLGAGAFGETFLIRRDGALKTVKKYKKSTSNKNEINILKRLMKTCVSKYVLCFDSFKVVDDYIYLTTEYLKGGDMFDYYKKLIDGVNYSKEIKNFRKFINQTCEAVIYIHSFNIVHYDIKPENIMLDSKQNVKLIDFGMAEIGTSSTITRPRGGTDGYAPYDIIFASPMVNTKYAKWYDEYAVLRTFYNTRRINPYSIITKGMPSSLVESLIPLKNLLVTELIDEHKDILYKLYKETSISACK